MAKLFSFSWQFGWVLCKLAHYSETLSVVCSVLNLTALSVERLDNYSALIHLHFLSGVKILSIRDKLFRDENACNYLTLPGLFTILHRIGKLSWMECLGILNQFIF